MISVVVGVVVAWESAAINATTRAVSLNPWSGDNAVLQALHNYRDRRLGK